MQIIFGEMILLDELAICKGALFITVIYCNFIMTRKFSSVYKPTRFIEIRNNLTIYYNLPGLFINAPNWAKEERLRTFYNTDGMGNCLRQPGQLGNQPQKSMRENLKQLIKLSVP